MTRKHYVKLAESLRFAAPIHAGETPAPSPQAAQWQADVRAVADVLAADNGRFDRSRFYAACGLDR